MAALEALVRRALAVLRAPAVRVAFLLLAVALAVVALAREWPAVSDALGRLPAWAWAASVPLALAGLLASMLSWRAVLADLGSPLPATAAARVYFVGQLGKYVPGSVWPVLAQMEMASGHGVPRRRSAAAFTVSVVVALSTGLLVACASLPVLPGELGGVRWLALLAPLFVVLLVPAVLNRVLGAAMSAGGREATESPLSGRGSARAAGWALAAWLCFGAQVWVVALAFGAEQPLRTLALGVGGYTLAWSAGFLFVVAPAGAGVREVALVAALSPVLGSGEAIAAALLSRVLLTAGDLVAAGVAALGSRGRRLTAGAAGVRRAD
jgi:uncharacterized membrane protein YbhN (UPF0104 family)